MNKVALANRHVGQETPPTRHVGPGGSAHPVTCMHSCLGEQREVPAEPQHRITVYILLEKPVTSCPSTELGGGG